MSLANFFHRVTSRQTEHWAVSREETPRRFHVRRTVGIAISAVVVMFLPLGANRIWASVAIMIAGFLIHAIHTRVPNRNVDGATQWVVIFTALWCAAILPALLPAAAVALAVDIAGSSRTFQRKLNYLFLAVAATGIAVIGFMAAVPSWVAIFTVFVIAIPGSVELAAWRSERTRIEQRRMALLSNLGQAITWESHLENDELLWVDGPVRELLGIAPSKLVELVNGSDDFSPLADFKGEGIEWVTQIPHVDGTPRWFRVNGQLRTRADGAQILYGVSVDITDLELARLHEQQRAEHDSLTGLSNREGLAEFLSENAERAARAVLVADIDRFKDINDTLGHIVGDRLICAVAARLDKLDSTNRIVARLGGDEFAIAVVADSFEQVSLEAETLVGELSKRLSADSPSKTWSCTLRPL